MNYLCTVLLFVSAPCLAIADSSLVADVIPPLSQQSPRLRFHLGQVANNQPLISPILPDLPFPPSPWYVAQWQQTSYIQPDVKILSNETSRGKPLGRTVFQFEAPDGHAKVRIHGHEGSWTYQLEEQNGFVTEGGGSNLFLSVDANKEVSTFDAPILFDADVKLNKAQILAYNQSALKSGAVLASIFSGFGLSFLDPITHKSQFVFMQVAISGSRNNAPGARYFCSLTGGDPNLLYGPPESVTGSPLPFRPDAGNFHHISYNVTDLVHDLISTPYPCGEKLIEWPTSATLVKNWRLTNFYIGLETEVEDHRKDSSNAQAQGNLDVSLEISHLTIKRISKSLP